MKTFRFYAFNTESFLAFGTTDEAGEYREKVNANRRDAHFLFEEISEQEAVGNNVLDLEAALASSEN